MASSIRGAQTLDKGLQVLEAVANGSSSLTEIVDATKLAKSSTHRLLNVLVERNYLRKTDDARYVLGGKLIEHGFSALQANPLPVVARPSLERLSELVKDTIHLAIEDNGSVLYLYKLEGRRGIEMKSRIGHRMPLSKTGLGKALILDNEADWEQIYKNENIDPSPQQISSFLKNMRNYQTGGYTFDLEENETDIRCVAAPIRDGSTKIIGAISVGGIKPYMPISRMKGLIKPIRGTAAEISKNLGFRHDDRKNE